MAARHKQELAKSPSKNLAHVPCKFFKQGTCQAGNSCPFSHTVDAELGSAPCKYFQKGNCRFGVKCALAHILPDGRRVNPKTLAQVYQNHNIANGNNSSGNNSGNKATLSSNTAAVATPMKQGVTKPDSSNTIAVTAQQSPPNTGPGYAYSSPASFYTSPPHTAGSGSHSQSPTHQRSGSIWSAAPQPVNANPLRRVSDSFSAHPLGSFTGSYQPETIDESAVADDEDDVFEEDFVPSSLSDLLTPQERERRNSRPSFSRPIIAPQAQSQYQNFGSDQTVANATEDNDEGDTQFRMDDDFELNANTWTNSYNGINAGY